MHGITQYGVVGGIPYDRDTRPIMCLLYLSLTPHASLATLAGAVSMIPVTVRYALCTRRLVNNSSQEQEQEQEQPE